MSIEKHEKPAIRDPSRFSLSQATGTFDVAISFTSRDPEASELAAELALRLRARSLRVFFFRSIEEAAAVLGERLSEILPAVYRDRARVVVLVGSHHYGQTFWTEVELKAALERPQDEDGRPRIVPISADGRRVPQLPEDIIHLGEQVKAALDLRAAVDLLATRCGFRREPRRLLLILSAVIWGALLLLAQHRLAGAPAGLMPWTMATLFSAIGLSLLLLGIPALWMLWRRKSVGHRLRVVTEGPRLHAFRRYAWGAASLWLACGLVLTALFLGQWMEARLRTRDIGVLISEGALLPALNRIEANAARLGRLKEGLFDGVQRRLQRDLSANNWATFPAIYSAYCAVRGQRDQKLEQAFWKACGAERMRPGEDGSAFLRAADQLVVSVPDLADRLFRVALARQLEYLMADQDFYYGFEGTAAWRIYRQLGDVAGEVDWIREDSRKALGDLEAMNRQIGGRNLGLSARLIVPRMLQGDTSARERVVRLLTLKDFAPDTAVELAETKVSEALARQLEGTLLQTWKELHAREGPSPDGFALGQALANLQTSNAIEALFASAHSAGDQERAHAVAGLVFLLKSESAEWKERCQRALARAAEDKSELVRYSLANSLRETGRAAPSVLGVYLQDQLHAFLQFAAPSTDQTEAAKTSLELYRGEHGIVPDAALVAAVEKKLNPSSPQASELPHSFEKLAAFYDGLGAPPGEAAGAHFHVRVLQEFGRLGDARGIAFLQERFPNLGHGNMRIAAAESLWCLQGALGETVLSELRSLTNMKSSVYRIEAVVMLSRNPERLRRLARAERDQVLAILDQVVNTGEAEERSQATHLLQELDAAHAWNAASRLTNSNRKDDQLAGLASLLELWNARIRTGPK